MAITAVALLRGSPALAPGLKAVALDDATLVHTEANFAAEPEELTEALAEAIGDPLAEHDDERGLFVLPSVAKPKARTYDGVVEEIGEIGMWLEPPDETPGGDLGAALAGMGGGGFGALVGEIMGKLGPEALADMQRAVLTGDFDALMKMQGKITEAMGGEQALEARSEELMRATEEGREMAEQLSSQLGAGVDLEGLMSKARSAADTEDDEQD